MSPFESENIGLSRGDHLHVEGDPSNRIHLLSQGSLEILRDAETLGALDQRGDPVGLSETALRIPRQTTIRAREESLLKGYELTGNEVYDWVEEHPLTGLRSMRNNARLLDALNKENKKCFDRFRESRDLFEPLVGPLTTLFVHFKNADDHGNNGFAERVLDLFEGSFLRQFVRNYRTIVNATGRSVKQAPSDLSVPEDVQESHPSGVTICEEGSKDEIFYILLEGTLSVHKSGQRVATIDEPGSIFGEMSALLSGRRTATIRTDSDCRVAAFPREKLREVFEESPGLGRTMLKTFLKRLQRSVTLNKNLTEFLDQLRRIRNAGELPESERQRLLKTLKVLDSEESDNNLEEPIDELKEFLREGFSNP